MKRLLTIVVMLAATATLQAQNSDCDTITQLPWTESFPSDQQGCWTFVDCDGTGHNWSIDGIHPYDGSYSLASFFSTQLEDNWAISQAIALPADMGSAAMTWQVYSHNYNETYEVLVSSNGSDNLDDFTMLFGETVTGGYFERQVDLTDYLGQVIHVAFRHRSQNQNFICIDRIQVSASPAPNVPTVTIEAPDSALVNSEVTLTAVSSNSDLFSWTLPGATILSASGNSVTAVWTQPGQFTAIVVATNENGNSSASKSIVIYGNANISGVESDNLVTIYPNPTTGFIAIDCAKDATLELIDFSGKIMTTGIHRACTSTLNIGELPSGSYILRATTDEGIVTKTIVKQF